MGSNQMENMMNMLVDIRSQLQPTEDQMMEKVEHTFSLHISCADGSRTRVRHQRIHQELDLLKPSGKRVAKKLR